MLNRRTTKLNLNAPTAPEQQNAIQLSAHTSGSSHEIKTAKCVRVIISAPSKEVIKQAETNAAKLFPNDKDAQYKHVINQGAKTMKMSVLK